uniref:uncharacterized protein LOC117250818 isoform X1 n=1 Tax=Epinephelus lanceolatus TaxID=310571 RepID=UPI001445B93B|nr:uncharacterized protein LOC117250818 isoform X1 [Epinephelus lanceolatus]
MDVQPTNLQQLCDVIMSIWTKISEECFQHLVESMTPRIKKGVHPGPSKVYLIKWAVSMILFFLFLCRYFPYEEENNHKLVREIGNVTMGLEITFQFAVKPEFMEVFLQKDTLPFQLQLSFKTRDQDKVTRVITEQRPVTTCSRIWAGSLNMAVLGVHCAQLCASLTMEGRVEEAQRQLKAQQDLHKLISKQRPIKKEESIYGNWMDTMTSICDDITMESRTLSDEAAKVMYQMKRASSNSNYSNTTEVQKKTRRKKKALVEGM